MSRYSELIWFCSLLALFVVVGLSISKSPAIVVAEPIVITRSPFESLSLSDQRDSLIAWEARKQGVPVWLALSVGHAENWGGDSTAVNYFSGALGLGQIHPVNFGRFPECGENLLNRRTNVCYMMKLLTLCRAEMLATLLSCYGGATSLQGRRNYNLDVTRQMRLEWLDD